MLPKELLEIVLIKTLLSFYNSTWRAFPFTDFNPYRSLIAVCSEWWKLITQRHWFQSTVKAYLASTCITKVTALVMMMLLLMMMMMMIVMVVVVMMIMMIMMMIMMMMMMLMCEMQCELRRHGTIMRITIAN